MEALSQAASGFIGLFELGGRTFISYFFTIGKHGEITVGIVPTLICLMTAVNGVINLAGKDRVEGFGRRCSKYLLLRYTVLPVIGLFFFTSPMCFTLGRFLEERHKPAFYDATVSFCHPITGLFPHAHAGEICVYNGVTAGLLTLGYRQLGDIAIRYFLMGLVVILLRGIVCEQLTRQFLKKGAQANGGSILSGR